MRTARKADRWLPAESRLARPVALAVMVVSALVAPAVSAAPAERSVVLFAYRTTTAAGSLDLYVDALPGNQPSAIGVALTSIDGGNVIAVDGSAATFGAADEPKVNVGGRRSRLCTDHGICDANTETWSAGMGLFVTSPAGRDGVNAIYVAARGRTVDYSFKANGWQVKRVPGTFRWVDGDVSSTAGAYGLGSGVEASAGTSSPGGRYGSFGIAVAPCSQSTSGVVSRGVGTFALEGGRTRPELICPATANAIASWADAATTWRATGAAVGETTLADARLFVLDRTRTLPVPRRWPWR